MEGTILFGGLAFYTLFYAAFFYKVHKDSIKGESETKNIHLAKHKEIKLLNVGSNESYLPTYNIGKELKGEEILKRLSIVLEKAKGQIEFEGSGMVYDDLQFVLDFMKSLNEESLEDFVNFSAFHESAAIATISNSINRGVFIQDNVMLIYLLVEVGEQLKESRLRYIERHSKDLEEELSYLKQSKDLNHKALQF